VLVRASSRNACTWLMNALELSVVFISASFALSHVSTSGGGMSRSLVTTTQASSEVRAAREAVASGGRSLESARRAAEQARQVVGITNISYRAGAATNIEVIDAERSARDADIGVAIAEDRLRRARLELLNALGRFP